METSDKDLIEEKTGSEKIFDGNLLHVYKDTVKLPNGGEATREWIKHPGASAVIPLTDDGQVILVKQYRYPIGRITLEIPAGKLDAPDEDPLLCAERELSEETGYKAEDCKSSILSSILSVASKMKASLLLVDGRRLFCIEVTA